MSRAVLLADLADHINQLTRPRQHHEYVEETVTRTITTRNGKTRVARTRERRKHTTTLPPLLDELRDAAMPGSSELGSSSSGFESRPPAELGPVSVLREIVDDAGYWCRVFRIERDTLAKTLQALVGARHDDEQLTIIVSQAERWVRRARQATGHDPAPRHLNQKCPLCGRKALTVSGELDAARCQHCGANWTTATIGLLTEMIRYNQQQETMTEVAAVCWMPDCRVRGPHVVHADNAGRTWRDTCEVDRRGESMSA